MSIHGTMPGWRKHHKAGVPPCDACLAANRDYQHQLRKSATVRCTPGLGWPLREPLRERIAFSSQALT